MKFARHVLEYIAARALLALLALLPLSLATRIALFVSRALFASLPRLRRIGLRNLELAFPNLSLAERRRLLKQSFENFGRIIADFAHFRARLRPILPLALKPRSLKHCKHAIAPPRLLDAA
jgi:KDO2-lipid IV(A) lauroyltransferase